MKKNKNPLVSVVLPVFNGKDFVDKAIESIMNQTFRNFELLIIDDGSTDSTCSRVLKYKDKRIKLLRQEHKGLCAALNLGLKNARGDIIARMDADDISLPNRLKIQVNFLKKNPKIKLVGTLAKYTLQNGNYYIPKKPITDKEIKKALIKDNPFIHSTVVFKKDVLETIGYYKNYIWEDYDLWLRIANKYQTAIIPKALIIYRVRENSISRINKKIKSSVEKLILQLRAFKIFGGLSFGSLVYIYRSICGILLLGLRKMLNPKRDSNIEHDNISNSKECR